MKVVSLLIRNVFLGPQPMFTWQRFWLEVNQQTLAWRKATRRS